MKDLIVRIQKDYPNLNFQPGEAFSWSAQQQTVFFVENADDSTAPWSLLHELGHATHNHTDYRNDFALIQMEVEAWTAAKELAKKYGHQIDEDHIQDCLDTYRDWLHQRSSCPNCSNVSLQKDARTYECYNCGQAWQVTPTRHCRPYRRKTNKQKQPA